MYVMSLMRSDRSRGGTSRTRGGGPSRGGKRPTSSFRKTPTWQKVLPVVLLGLAVVSLVLGLTGFRFDRQTSHGTAILVIDVSSSMDRTDIQPTRLVAAQAAATSFLDELPGGTRVGVIAFAGMPDEVVPPTADHEEAAAALADLPRGRGTRIGDALSAAIDAILSDWDEEGKREAAVVLLSDGITLVPDEVPPEVAAERAAGLEIPVSTVLLSGRVELENDQLLQDIAETTGAESFTAETAAELNTVYEGLGEQLSTDLEVSETSSLYILIAVGCAIAAAVLVLVAQRPDY
jgi:Ca-activated chloride channel family protein